MLFFPTLVELYNGVVKALKLQLPATILSEITFQIILQMGLQILDELSHVLVKLLPTKTEENEQLEIMVLLDVQCPPILMYNRH